MARDDVNITVRLRRAREFQGDARKSASEVRRIGTSADAAGKATTKAGKGTGIFARGLRGVGSAARLATPFLGAYTAVAAGKTIIEEWREAQKVNRDTAAVIKSTGGAAKVSAGGVAALSQQISGVAGIDDEEIQSAANKLLTFQTIANRPGKGNDIFNQTLQAATDLGARFDQGLKPSVIQLGKALADPEKGLSKLSRTGINFTAQETEKIKALQQSGDLLGAQKIMLGAVNKQVKGAAAAKADPFDKLNVSMKNLAETIGFAVGPTLARWADSLAKFVTQMESGTGAGGRFVDKLKSIYQWASRNWGAIKRVGIAVAALAVTFKTIKLARSVASEVSGAVTSLRGMGPRMRKALSGVRGIMRRVFLGAGTAAGDAAASSAATTAASSIGPDMSKKRGKFTAVGRTAGRAIGTGIIAGLVLATPAIGTAVLKALDDAFGSNFEGIASLARRTVGDAIKSIVPGIGGFGQAGIGGFGQAGRPGIGGADLAMPSLRLRTPVTALPVPAALPALVGGAGGPSEAVIHMPIYLDGRQIAENTRRHALNDQARQ